ncbi:hypothetical protein MESS2_870016 [Mesorhizobium metallidurans STM 2683]|uniref:Uncharacterized protein n=1 Tax=Mesorhizobium metallidurans STM 2683 TaxID=1297569 RepID=M5EYP1_9HYPH|nr:hypothetical protein MESS2_870016 [Mesorhizobium metallidurans STM 2683]
MSDVIEAFLVVIGFEEPETLPRSLHPLKPNSAWSSGEWVFGIGPPRGTSSKTCSGTFPTYCRVS